MYDNHNEPLLTYALDSSGKMVHIKDVVNGRKCNCRCPQCNEPLDAKQGNGGHQPHFAHQGGSDCQGAYMTALHKLAEQIIEEEKAVMAPSYEIIGEQKLLFKEVEVEQRVDRSDMQPDLVGITEDGKRWIVEIRNTHEVKKEKRKKISDNNITCLEIDVRNQELDKNKLRTFLLESAENREWINNPNYDDEIEKIHRNIVSQVANYFLSNNPIVTIPFYRGTRAKEIEIHDSSVLDKSNDGLLIKIKCSTIDGSSYIFNIGEKEIIEKAGKSEKEYNELTIYTDELSLDSSIYPRELTLEWMYNADYERKEKCKYEKYRNESGYEFVKWEECAFNCKERFSYTNCKHRIDKVCIDNCLLVVCDKEKQSNTQIGNKTESDYPQGMNNNDSLSSSQTLQQASRNENIALENYIKYLQRTKHYRTKEGEDAEVIECRIIKKINRIIVLYRLLGDKRKLFYPYHIDYVKWENEEYFSNKVADFINKKEAINGYIERIKKYNDAFTIIS